MGYYFDQWDTPTSPHHYYDQFADISELEHSGVKGMKWYQHIFGDIDSRAKYAQAGGGGGGEEDEEDEDMQKAMEEAKRWFQVHPNATVFTGKVDGKEVRIKKEEVDSEYAMQLAKKKQNEYLAAQQQASNKRGEQAAKERKKAELDKQIAEVMAKREKAQKRAENKAKNEASKEAWKEEYQRKNEIGKQLQEASKTHAEVAAKAAKARENSAKTRAGAKEAAATAASNAKKQEIKKSQTITNQTIASNTAASERNQKVAQAKKEAEERNRQSQYQLGKMLDDVANHNTPAKEAAQRSRPNQPTTSSSSARNKQTSSAMSPAEAAAAVAAAKKKKKGTSSDR